MKQDEYLNLIIDYQWEEYGKEKITEAIPDYNPKRKNSGRKTTTRAERRKATAHKKNKNRKLSKSKGYKLNLCSRPNKAGTRCAMSDNYIWTHTYDSVEIQQQKKLTKKEIKEYLSSVNITCASDIDWNEIEYYENNCWDIYERDFNEYEDYYDYYEYMKHTHNNLGTPVREILWNYFLKNTLTC